MRNLLIFLVLGVLAWQGYSAYQARAGSSSEVIDHSESSETAQLLDQEAASDSRSPYHCDGRVYCSQMTSCDEAELASKPDRSVVTRIEYILDWPLEHRSQLEGQWQARIVFSGFQSVDRLPRNVRVLGQVCLRPLTLGS